MQLSSGFGTSKTCLDNRFNRCVDEIRFAIRTGGGDMVDYLVWIYPLGQMLAFGAGLFALLFTYRRHTLTCSVKSSKE